MAKQTYTNLPDGRTIICQLQLSNGCSVEGKAVCTSIENFNQETGNKKARINAREMILELEGYDLRAGYLKIYLLMSVFDWKLKSCMKKREN